MPGRGYHTRLWGSCKGRWLGTRSSSWIRLLCPYKELRLVSMRLVRPMNTWWSISKAVRRCVLSLFPLIYPSPSNNPHPFSTFHILGREIGERNRVVPLPSWIWMLAFGYRCEHPDEQPEVPGSVPGGRRASVLCGNTIFHLILCRSIQIAPSPQERSILAHSGRTPKTTLHQTHLHQSISQSR